MQQYRIVLKGITPLIMHSDNLVFSEKVAKWQRDPANKELSVAGDDRSPAWRWIGYLYHDTKTLGIPSDNLMTMLREGGSKVINRGKETYKKQTQSGIMIDQQQWQLLVNDKPIPLQPFADLIGENDFSTHLTTAEQYGFELLVKRAKVGQTKHVRVRPMFREWAAAGSLTVIDEELSGISRSVLDTILKQAGAVVGIGDWRPSSPRGSGTFGKFVPELVSA